MFFARSFYKKLQVKNGESSIWNFLNIATRVSVSFFARGKASHSVSLPKGVVPCAKQRVHHIAGGNPGAYAARYVAKNIVAAGIADRCEIQLAYAIGVAQPISIMVDTFGTSKIPNQDIVTLIKDNFDLRPAGIINSLGLRRPLYRQTAAYGHFGRTDIDLPWENTDKAEALRQQVGVN